MSDDNTCLYGRGMFREYIILISCHTVSSCPFMHEYFPWTYAWVLDSCTSCALFIRLSQMSLVITSWTSIVCVLNWVASSNIKLRFHCSLVSMNFLDFSLATKSPSAPLPPVPPPSFLSRTVRRKVVEVTANLPMFHWTALPYVSGTVFEVC